MVIPFHSPASADDRSRTCNFLLVRQALSQLSYISIVVAGRFELPLTAYQTVFLPLEEATISKLATRIELATF